MWREPKFILLLSSAIIVGILECLSLAGLHLPNLIAIPLFLAFIFSIGWQTLWHGLQAILTLNFKSINALMLIAVAGAWYLGKYEEATIVIILYVLAEKLEEIGIHKSQSALRQLLEKMPIHATLKKDGQSIPVEKIHVGDIILIKPGELIPLDGKVLGGSSFVDESSITGEPIPHDKSVNDLVYAGTLNMFGNLEIEVSKLSAQTTFAKIKELTMQAAESKAPTQTFIENFSQFYTPTVIVIALIWIFAPILLFGYSLDTTLPQGLALIVIACPCALVISTPVSIFSAMGNASKHGAIIKGGKYLEFLGQASVVALDKTRTLTYGRPVVTDIIPYGTNSKEHLLACAAGIEFFSEHPIAQSIVENANLLHLPIHPIENFKSFVGKGARADCLVCNDKHHCLGKLSFILEEHSVPQHIIDEIEELQKMGKTPVVLATHGEVEGIIALTDEIRPNSFALIRQLKELGIPVILLTGDHYYSALAVANQLDIKEIRAELLPDEKARIIQELIEENQIVVMVGDGINDAPALALSHVGISIGSLSSDMAVENSSVIILHDHLDVIPFLIYLGKKTLQTIRGNIALAITVKIFFIGLALFGLSNLALAIFADVGVTLIVILISLRLMNYPRIGKHE